MSQHIHYFSEESLRRDLKSKTVRGGMYTGLAQALQVGLQLASLPILARLLSPADFGLVAMVTVFTGFAAMFVDAGLSMATIQRESLTHQQASNLFWVGSVLGLLIAIFVCVISPAISWFFGEPRLVLITIALSTSFVFSGLTVQSQALLSRAMQFRALAIRQVAAAVAGVGCALFIAWSFRSYWALVAQTVVAAFVRMVATWSACQWWPSRPGRGSGVRELLRYGANLSLGNMANYFASTLDRIAIGRLLGPEATGLYDQAWRILLYPLRQLNAPLSTVMLPALSRSVNHHESYERRYFAALTALTMVVTPIIAVLIACPEIVAVTLLGEQWRASGQVLQVFSFGILSLVTTNATSWLAITQNRVETLRQCQVADAIGRPFVVAAGLPWGITGVAWAITIRTVVFAFVLIWQLSSPKTVSASALMRFFFGNVARIAICTLAVYGVVVLVNELANMAILCVATATAILATIAVYAAIPSGRSAILNYITLLSQHMFGRA